MNGFELQGIAWFIFAAHFRLTREEFQILEDPYADLMMSVGKDQLARPVGDRLIFPRRIQYSPETVRLLKGFFVLAQALRKDIFGGHAIGKRRNNWALRLLAMVLGVVLLPAISAHETNWLSNLSFVCLIVGMLSAIPIIVLSRVIRVLRRLGLVEEE
jgi:hypothetical protein